MPHPAGHLYDAADMPPCKRCNGTRWSIEQDWTGWTASCLQCGNVAYDSPTLPLVATRAEQSGHRTRRNSCGT